MKKILCIVLALMCLSMAALAESTPSRTTSDMTTVETSVPGVALTAATTEAYPALVATCDAEIAKLAAAADVATYFGTVTDSTGAAVDLATLLNGTLSVDEFFPMVASGYDTTLGNVAVTMTLSTAYEVGEEVIVLAGIVAGDGTVTWTAFTGVGVSAEATEAQGSIEVEFTPEIVEAMQTGNVLVAVVSAA